MEVYPSEQAYISHDNFNYILQVLQLYYLGMHDVIHNLLGIVVDKNLLKTYGYSDAILPDIKNRGTQYFYLTSDGGHWQITYHAAGDDIEPARYKGDVMTWADINSPRVKGKLGLEHLGSLRIWDTNVPKRKRYSIVSNNKLLIPNITKGCAKSMKDAFQILAQFQRINDSADIICIKNILENVDGAPRIITKITYYLAIAVPTLTSVVSDNEFERTILQIIMYIHGIDGRDNDNFGSLVDDVRQPQFRPFPLTWGAINSNTTTEMPEFKKFQDHPDWNAAWKKITEHGESLSGFAYVRYREVSTKGGYAPF